MNCFYLPNLSRLVIPAVVTALLAQPLVAERSGQVKELPVQAQYCAILQALSNATDPRCSEARPAGMTRGIVFRDPLLEQGQDVQLRPNIPVIGAGSDVIAAQNLGSTRSFAKAALPATKSPGDAGYYIQFAFDSDVLGDDYKAHLDRLADVLNSDVMRETCLKIVGHTDTIGSSAYNQTLSERRARSVAKYLTSDLGLSTSRVFSEGMGESIPLPDIPGGHPQNRRVELLSRDISQGCGA